METANKQATPPPTERKRKREIIGGSLGKNLVSMTRGEIFIIRCGKLNLPFGA
jgi:hypothetical protein